MTSLLAGGVLALCCLVPAVVYAQADTTDPATESGTASAAQAIDADAIVAPREVVEETKEQPAEEPSQQQPADPPAVGSGEARPTETQPRIALGNAAFQGPRVKNAEARRACTVGKPPPTSPMLGMIGTTVVDDPDNRGLLLLVPAAGIGLFALYLTVRRRGAPGARPGDPLERVATLVAITAGLAGLVLEFAPGVAVAERPVREATMKVREVHPRVTRGEYAKAIGATTSIPRIDGREVGNVIWLELRLRGYEGARPVLQYGLYDEARGEVLLSNTAKEARLGRQRGDEQKSFVPIWVGYPTTSRFRARFRLLDDGRVQELARTGKMRGSAYRYACTRS